ncbi:MAG: hypothetical protein KAQ98_11975 [Bacteriovoracaceae bacterium]|nr:hypothetical protein [Bacteriovoracaceae bacterium]
MIKIGKINELTVCGESSSGHYLKSDDSEEEVLMPHSLGPKEVIIDQKLKVFVYLDSNDSLLATITIPNAIVGEYGFMKVVDTQPFGAFLNWGITKDLLIPDSEQRSNINKNENHIVRVCIDDRTERIYGTTKINKYIQASEFDIKEGDNIKIVPAFKEELGYRCIINRKFIGMIYHNEIFGKIKIGEPVEGVVKKLRPDGLVDAALQTQGIQNLMNSKDKILAYLEQIGGKSPLHDKSSPQDIREALGMSKQTFKNTIGMLYKERKILILKDGIKLVKKPNS